MIQDPGCLSCGGTVAPDGHCWDCGADQEGFHAHAEATTAGGAAGISDRGLRRGINADAMALVETAAWTIGVACDGVSMTPRSERAARLAARVGARTLAEDLAADEVPETALERSTHAARRAVAALAGPEVTAPACTYVAGLVGPGGLWVAWVGDSRAYWLPEHGVALSLTRDHTTETGAITAWLGADAENAEPGIRSLSPRTRGELLLCTDGLTRYLPRPDDLRSVAHPGPARAWPESVPAARALVDHALAAGGHDNVTALLLPSPAPPGEKPAGKGFVDRTGLPR